MGILYELQALEKVNSVISIRDSKISLIKGE